MKTMIMMCCLAFLSYGTFAQNDHSMHGQDHQTNMDHQKNMVMFKDAQVTTAYEHYLALKDALVASEQEPAKSAAVALQKSLKALKGSSELAGMAGKVTKAGTIALQRQAFSELSNGMTQLVKDQEISMGELYLEYCPMANNNEGAYWLSNESKIKNPYFGAMMLSCGKVAETIH